MSQGTKGRKSMLAVLQQTKDGYVVRFERHLKHSVEKVWSSLSD